ncbi:hypothetical protein, partial [Bradyrhizobium sp. CCBAU 65884]|uniref:hypothetical protein n=1 Tax=Bradyrhizobium sp. CCBAU 65884 TaxID=722477 RepID=UPI002305E585
MGSETPSNPHAGRSARGAPEPEAFLKRNGREEPDAFVRRGKKLAAWVLAGGALPIGLCATRRVSAPLKRKLRRDPDDRGGAQIDHDSYKRRPYASFIFLTEIEITR